MPRIVQTARQGAVSNLGFRAPNTYALKAVSSPAIEGISVTFPRFCALLPDPLRGEATMLTVQLQAMTAGYQPQVSPSPGDLCVPGEAVEALFAFRREALSL